MQIYIPIKTPFGELYGRDCIYLDRVVFENGMNTFSLEGEINGRLCQPENKKEWIPYLFRFTGILALNFVELDSWCKVGVSCFDEILKSEWKASLKGKITENHRHFILQTYDDVFDIICEDFFISERVL